jgi:hypothetical protein
MDSKIVDPVQKNNIAKIALEASIFNIVCWLLIAIPGFLLSPWSTFELVTIPLSAIIALAAGIMGLLKVRVYGTGLWQSAASILVGLLNIWLITISLIGISAMVNCC